MLRNICCQTATDVRVVEDRPTRPGESGAELELPQLVVQLGCNPEAASSWQGESLPSGGCAAAGVSLAAPVPASRAPWPGKTPWEQYAESTVKDLQLQAHGAVTSRSPSQSGRLCRR